MVRHWLMWLFCLSLTGSIWGCGGTTPIPSPSGPAMTEQPTVQEPSVDQSRVIQGMQKQLRQRDRQIAILQSQLEALRLIDQDQLERKRQPRVPTTSRHTEIRRQNE